MLIRGAPLLLLLALQGIDVLDLIRAIRAARSQGDAGTSRAIRLVDPATERTAQLRIHAEGTGELFVAVELPKRGDRLFAHTFRITLDGSETLNLRVLELPASAEPESGELVLAPLSEEQLGALTSATSIEVSLQGWDEKFVATIDDKGLERLEQFRARRAVGDRS